MANIEARFAQEVEDHLVATFSGVSRSSWGRTQAVAGRSMFSRFKKLITGG
jgi:hypothetical protein